MTNIQEQAVNLIQQLPDSRLQAIIRLAESEIKQLHSDNDEIYEKKKRAFLVLNSIDLDLPENFDPDKEFAEGMEEKYGPLD
jgi:hypothetical protein